MKDGEEGWETVGVAGFLPKLNKSIVGYRRSYSISDFVKNMKNFLTNCEKI